ncbi:MAG: AAA family ATPase [Gemmatimonadetes bacterium]|nr:AAA family ATPase [Gemmatimonadota bacterium]
MSTRRFLELLTGVQGGNGKWTARCPAHDDHRASLSVTEAQDGEPVVHCHAGCDWLAVFAAVPYERPRKDRDLRGGYSTSRREVAVYPYTNADGAPLYEVVRFDPKDFRQRRALPAGGYEWKLNGVPRVPFHLPALITTVKAGGRVYVVEGEKDVLALEALGLTATTNAGGAEKWEDAFAAYFAGADVVILPDNDEPGRKHAERVARSVLSVAASVRVVPLPDLPPKGDISDWLAAGRTAHELALLVEQTARWVEPQAHSAPRLRYYTLGELVTRPELLAEPDPVVPPFLFRGRVTLLAGREKLGKSTLVAHAAAALSRGEEFLGATLAAGRVLWYSLDEGLNDTVRRFQALGAAHGNVLICPDRPGASSVTPAKGAASTSVTFASAAWSMPPSR